ncbi:uncharacterized protein LOC120631230 [Pararge aegeria]|uniref:uncharacterized protein LOC120631230 n=1 Tax=Pararge aegeria TaxID=116150 RepID=UPI0019D243E9|nr:uncharacterized protein LOC120631230 [Pararge aegeria]
MDIQTLKSDIFIDIATSEAIKNQIPFIITDEISGVNITEEPDRGTLFSLSYFENCEALTNITKVIDKRIKYFIIVQEICENIKSDLLSELQFYDVMFFTSDQDNGKLISIKVTSEMDEESCRSMGHIKMEVTIINHNESYENKERQSYVSTAALNLKKCKFNVGLASLYPYSMIKNKKYLKTFDPLQIDDINGSDVEIIKIIANYLNATLNLHYVHRNEENPYFDSDYLKFVINGSLDACVGGLYKIYGDIVSYSGIYSTQAIVWVYSVERNTRSWQTLFGKMHGLYIFLIIYIIYSIIWKIVCKFDGEAVSMKDTLLYSWGALLGTTSLQDARTVKQRILNILYLIMSLFLSTYISCQIYSYLTIVEPPPHYRTIDELENSDRIPYLVPVSKYFVKDKKYETIANASRDCINFEDCEIKLINNKASTVLIDGHLPFLQSRTAVNDEARVLRVANEILTIYHEMIIRKYSPFVESYNKVTQRLFESGICRRLYDEAIGITVVDKAKIANKNILSNSYSCTVGCQITLLQLAGIFYILIIGCFISICIFIIELLSYRQKQF